MLAGERVTLRPVDDADLEQLYQFHIDINNRGEFFPRGIQSKPSFNRQIQESGFWSTDCSDRRDG